MKELLLILIVLLAQQGISQEMIRCDLSKEDPYHFYMNDNDSTNLFYYKMVPRQKPIGALVILPSGGESIESVLNQITLHEEALKNDLLVIIPSYNWGTIQQIPEMDFFDTIFRQVIEEHKVSKDNFILCGLSNGGIFSLNYAIRSVRDSSTYLVPKGIIGLDPPLDLTRFYKYCEREIERNFSKAGVGEAKWIKSVYEQVYGGSPDSFPTQYREASIFSYGAKKGGNAQYLTNIAIRMHSDLNIDFLVNQRKRDLYDWNGTDIVAFVNQLKVNGNKKAEVIISQNKGKRPDGSLHPHSWSIMDTEATMEWILDLLNQDKEKSSFIDEPLSKVKYIEDLNQLIDSIKTHHPQPYEFISKKDFDFLVNKEKNKITDSTTIRQFSWICRSISARVGCLHTNTSAGNLLKLSPEIFFPLSVRYVDSKLYITESYAPNKPLKKGVEILKINGMDVLDLKKDIAAHISTDGYNQKLTSARINASFGYFCAYKFDFPSTYKLEINVNGNKQEVSLSQGEIHYSDNTLNAQSDNLKFTIKSSQNMAIITIKSFVYYHEHLPIFQSFIDSCFKQIELHNIENVVIDLRDNGGGDPYCAVHLLQYISNSPFRYYKKDMSSPYEDLTEKIKPFKNRFSGKVYVLINSLCCSTTGHLCSILKYHNWGTLIGSETGATYSCNAYSINFKLKNTGVNAFVATKTYQTDVSGFEKNKGIRPDYPITKKLENILNKKDLEMEKAIELILDN